MILIGLLAAALVCIVLGVVFASGPWFIGSLVASALAGFALFRQRDRLAGRGSGAATGSGGEGADEAGPSASRQATLVTGTAFRATNTTEPKAPAVPVPVAPELVGISVWVVDGQPEFHRETCAVIDGLSGEGASGESVPYVQAVQDGFVECASCRPTKLIEPAEPAEAVEPAEPAEAVEPAEAPEPSELTQPPSGPAPAEVSSESAPVWVIDGRPYYHVEACAQLVGNDGETVPRAQAVEDGFTPCAECRPDHVAEPTQVAVPRPPRPTPGPAVERLPAATDEVWVVDGRPRYHLYGCVTIKDQSAEPIALTQAAEDGFIPCSMCAPDAARV